MGFGPPLGGKDTLVSKLRKRYHIGYVSCGDVCRYHEEKKTPEGRQIQEYKATMKTTLAPSDVLLPLVEKAIHEERQRCKHVFLNGFIRKIDQIQAAVDMVHRFEFNSLLVAWILASRAVCESRIKNREQNRNDDHIFHSRYDEYQTETIPAVLRLGSLIEKGAPIQILHFNGELPYEQVDQQAEIIGLHCGLQRIEALPEASVAA